MSKIITISNLKGGVAKTTTALYLSSILAQNHNLKTLLIDLDPQTNLTLSFGVNPLDLNISITDVLENSKPIKDSIIQHPSIPTLGLIPSHPYLSGAEVSLMSKVGRERILKKALKPIKNDYDFIIIDCPPNLSLLTLNALSATDYLLIPIEAAPLAYYAVDKLLEVYGEIKQEVNENLELLGVVATHFDKRAIMDNKVLKQIKATYNLLGIISRSVKVKDSIADGVIISPSERVVHQYKQLVDKVLKEINKKEVK